MPVAPNLSPAEVFAPGSPYRINFNAEHPLFMHVACWNLPSLHEAIRPTAGRVAETA